MKRFNTMYEAAEYAVTRCSSWYFAYSNREVYDIEKMLVSAKMSDEENPADEDSFYVVSPNGEIGFCQDGKEIDWLFLSNCAVNEDIPVTLSSASKQTEFCPSCGSSIVPGAVFCGGCGTKLS